MARNNIGDLLFGLSLETDKNSFETGRKSIDSVHTALNKLIGTARNVTVALATTAAATGAVTSAEYKTAEAMGISIRELEMWSNAAKVAGVNSAGLVSSMGKLSQVMAHRTIDGAGLEQYSKQLGLLGLGFNELENMNASDAYAKILGTAQTKYTNATTDEDRLRINEIVRTVLGAETESFFIEMNRRGLSIDKMLGIGNSLNYTNPDSLDDSQDFAAAMRTTTTALTNITEALGVEVGAKAAPYMQQIAEWLTTHGTEIQTVIAKIGDGVETLLGKTKDAVEDGALVAEGVSNLGNLFTAEPGTEEWNEAQQALTETAEKMKSDDGLIGIVANFADQATDKVIDLTENITENSRRLKDKIKTSNFIRGLSGKDKYGKKKIDYADLSEAEQMVVENYIMNYGGNPRNITNIPALNDGIIRPDGSITQVAPDDWVFAARNIGDLARAFIPQNYSAAAPSVYTINQTFNIGATKDMPQVLKQQAYNGAREGLMQSMAQSSQRLQQMSGTR